MNFFKQGVVLVCFLATTLSAANPLVYTEPNPPFNFRDKGEVKGLSGELLEASMASFHPKLAQDEIRLDLWREIYKEAQAHPTSFLISVSRLKDRESSFQWVGPLATVKLGIITKKGVTLPKGNTYEMLKSLRIATIKETSSEKVLFQEVGENSNLNITRVSTPIQGYKMLEYGRVDALIYTDIPFVYNLVSEGQNASDYRMAHVLLSTDYYIGVGLDVPKDQVKAMQKQLDKLREVDSSGKSKYDQIFAKYLKGAVLQQ